MISPIEFSNAVARRSMSCFLWFAARPSVSACWALSFSTSIPLVLKTLDRSCHLPDFVATAYFWHVHLKVGGGQPLHGSLQGGDRARQASDAHPHGPSQGQGQTQCHQNDCKRMPDRASAETLLAVVLA